MPLLENTLQLFTQYGYGILLPVSIVEGPMATVLAGALAATGLMKLPVAYLVVVLGDVIGDALHYAAGRWGGRPLLSGFNKFSSVEKHFRDYPFRTLLFGKVQAWNSLILFASGAAKMPFLPFLGICLLGTAVKSGVLLLVGYFLGEALTMVAIDRYLKIAAVVFLVAGVVAIRAHFKTRRRPLASAL